MKIKVVLVHRGPARPSPAPVTSTKASLALTLIRKLQVMRDVLSALDHAHRHEVIHRNLTPDAILVTKGGRARVTGFLISPEWAEPHHYHR